MPPGRTGERGETVKGRGASRFEEREMSWNVIRTATETDREKYEAAAKRFCARHNLGTPDEYGGVSCYARIVEIETDEPSEKGKALKRLWKRCVRRALGPHAEGIAWDAVGYSAND